MQTLDIQHPGMPDLQFVLIVIALCTSQLKSLNISEELRRTIFDRCWSLLHDTAPPPTRPEERVLDLRDGTEVTVEAMVEIIRSTLTQAGVTILTWDHPATETSRTSSPEALPLIERLRKLYPEPPDVPDR